VFDNRHLPPQEPAQKIFESAEDELLDEEEKSSGLLRRIFRR